MKKILFGILVMVLLASTLLVVMPTAANPTGIPGDADGNDKLTKEELASAILSYMLGEGDLKLEDLRDGAHVYIYWNGETRTIVDSAGRTVTIYKPINRIVILHGEAVETLRSIKANDKIVGVGKYMTKDDIFFPEFSDYPNVGSIYGDVNYEEILKCNPDAVFLYATSRPDLCESIQNKLNELDPSITVVRIDCFRPESYVKEIKDLGYILEKEEEAETFIDFYEGFMNSIKEKVEDENRPEVYFEAYGKYKTAGRDSGWHEKLVAAGGNNLFSDLSGTYVNLDPEEVPKRNPEIIISVPSFYAGGYDTNDITELSDPWEEIRNRPELANVTAVKNKSVYTLNSDDLGGVRHFVAVGYLAKWFHPDLFKDLNPEAIHKRYLIEFQRLSGSLVDNGVFIYPPFES